MSSKLTDNLVINLAGRHNSATRRRCLLPDACDRQRRSMSNSVDVKDVKDARHLQPQMSETLAMQTAQSESTSTQDNAKLDSTSMFHWCPAQSLCSCLLVSLSLSLSLSLSVCPCCFVSSYPSACSSEMQLKPVPTYGAAFRLELHNPSPDPDPDFRPIELKFGTSVTYSCPGDRSHQLQFFCVLSFLFPLYGTDGRNDEQTDGRARRVMRPVRTAV